MNLSKNKPNFWTALVTDSKIIGLLTILSGVSLNRWALAWLVSPDHFIESSFLRMFILSGQVGLVLGGLWLLLKNRNDNWPGVVRGGLLCVCAVGVVFGSVGSAMRAYEIALEREWIQPRVKELSELCDWLSGEDVPHFGTSNMQSLIKKLERTQSDSGQVTDIIRLKTRLADEFLAHGRIDEAIAHLESAYQLSMTHELPEKFVNRVRRPLGISYLRSGEVSHCIDMHNPESCLFPIREGGVWVNPSKATKATRYFEEYLRVQPEDLGVRWLLNVAHMAAGTYPEGLSETAVIPLSVMESTDKVGRFKDIAPGLGLDTFNLAGGAIMDDFDNDGFLDIITSTCQQCESLQYFHNNGDGTFDNWTESANLSQQVSALNINQADYNNDGLLDILVLRGAWMGPEYGRQPNSLLRQNPDGSFTDVTKEAGLREKAFPCLAAAWADYDNDGNLDLYIGNESFPKLGIASFPGQLFHNNGDGTFRDVASQAGVEKSGYTRGVNWGDYDNDGDQDLYVSNLGQPNRLYRNNGNGTFTDVAKDLGVAMTKPNNRTFAAWFWDVNNDGWLDLFVAGYGKLAVGQVVADYLGLPASGERLQLYLNDGSGNFVDVTEAMKLNHLRKPMAANYGDIDNDGFLDFYLGTGAPPFDFIVPNVMYRNLGGKYFSNVTKAAGVGHLQKGHGIAFGDLDNDGDQDVFAQMGGFFPDDGFHDALFENPGNSNHWITIKLIGVQSNRAGIGAKIKLVVETNEGRRSIFNLVGSGGSFGGSSLQQEMGVGGATRIKELEVYWPASNTRQRFYDVAVDQVIEITEGDESYRVLERRSIRFTPKETI